MSLFSNQLAAGLAQIRAVAGDAWAYQCPAGTIPTLNATQGKTQYEAIDESGLTVPATATDFLVAAADLVINSQAVHPAPGDRLSRGGRVFEVMPLGNEKCFVFSDPDGSQLRIHTKQIA